MSFSGPEIPITPSAVLHPISAASAPHTSVSRASTARAELRQLRGNIAASFFIQETSLMKCASPSARCLNQIRGTLRGRRRRKTSDHEKSNCGCLSEGEYIHPDDERLQIYSWFVFGGKELRQTRDRMHNRC